MKVNRFKTFFITGIMLTTFSTIVMAQKKQQYKEIKISKTSEVINVSADELWKIIKDPKAVEKWSTLIDSATISGEPEFEGVICSERVCKVNAKGHHDSYEKITSYSEKTHEITFISTKRPSFILYVDTHWKVIEIGPKQSAIQMNNTMHLKRFMGFLLGGLMKKSIFKNVNNGIEDLTVFAETGEISEAKKSRIEALKKENKENRLE